MTPLNAANILEMPHILVVDDDRRLRDLIGRYLEQNGFCVSAADHAEHARSLLDILTFDAIVLDVMMPGESGVELTRALAARPGFSTPILMLTAQGESAARIQGLEAGADDYLPKPFEPRELALRLNAILRRVRTAPVAHADMPSLSFDGWRYDAARQILIRGSDTQNLTNAEATLLALLAEKLGHVHTRQDLAARAGLVGQERTIDVQVTRLRRKIEPDAKKPRYLLTARGTGYILHSDVT
jgi:two-component system phosphate regulon response regulator OmpR